MAFKAELVLHLSQMIASTRCRSQFGRYRGCTATSSDNRQHDYQHTELAMPTAERSAAPLVRDEEARARRVPDRAGPVRELTVTQGLAAMLADLRPGKSGPPVTLIPRLIARQLSG